MTLQNPDDSKVIAQFTFLMTEREIQERANRLGLPPPDIAACERIGRRLLAAWIGSDLGDQLYALSDKVIRDSIG